MAEGIAFGLAEKVLTELGSRAIQELGSAMGVKKELKKLERTLSTIKAVLLHAEELEVRQPQVREWLRRIKDAVYEADDIIDDFAIEALRKRLVMQDSVVNMVRYFFFSSNPIAYRFKISLKIRGIRESLTEIQADRSFHLDTRVEETRVRNAERENTHSHVDESKVFGRDVEKEEIVKLLLDLSGEGNLSIIPIYGMAGKLNFVGSSKEVCMGSRQVAGFGGTISNSDGPVIKPYAGSAGEVPSVDSEVLALWNGLKLLSTLPSSPVWIEGESELVIKWLTRDIDPPWRFTPMFFEIQSIMSRLVLGRISHNDREGNSLAHKLANEGLTKDSLTVWDQMPNL